MTLKILQIINVIYVSDVNIYYDPIIAYTDNCKSESIASLDAPAKTQKHYSCINMCSNIYRGYDLSFHLNI